MKLWPRIDAKYKLKVQHFSRGYIKDESWVEGAMNEIMVDLHKFGAPFTNQLTNYINAH